jgi:D-3-phosphoglycerate dehydrogenase
MISQIQAKPFIVIYLDYIEINLDLEYHRFKDTGISLVNGRDPGANKKLSEATVLMVTGSMVNKYLLDSMPQLKLVVRHGSGYDNIDVEECSRKGLPVIVIPNYCTVEVVEHTLAFIFASVRNLWTAKSLNSHEQRGAWQNIAPVHQLNLQKVGIIGYGEIGQGLSRILRLLNVPVFIYTPHPPSVTDLEEKFVSLEWIAKECDIISIHCSLNASSTKLINSAFLDQMKPTAWIINTARGPIIDQEALFAALRGKQLGGAAVDVLDTSLPFPTRELSELNNFIYSHHLAWYSDESLLQIRQRIIEAILQFAQTGEVHEKCINPHVLN